MAGPEPASTLVWAISAALGLGCFSLRLSFIQLHGWLFDFPPVVERSLGYLPPAILAALVITQLVDPDGSIVTMVVNERVVAGGVAAVVAWRTRSMTATIGVGMAVLWALSVLLG